MEPDHGTDAGYRVFTRDFDSVVDVAALDEVLGPLTVKDAMALDEAWRLFQMTLVGWKTAAHLAALAAAGSIRQALTDADRADTVVTLLIDLSGSMRGQKMLLAAAAVDVAQDFLRQLGCQVEVLGFTTCSWQGGEPRRRWIAQGRPPSPGRLCETLHVICRTADDPRASAGDWAFRQMLRPDLLKENVDGEALEWACARLRARPERRRMVVLLGDGPPDDQATVEANDAGYLTRHLAKVIGRLEQDGDIELAAVGIGCGTEPAFPHTRTVQAIEDLGIGLIDLLAGMLLRRPLPDVT